MKLTKNEIESLKQYGFDISNIHKPIISDVIKSLVVISHGRKNMHDSGYPLIKIIGFNKKNEAINLGWHDHIIINVPVNIDSFGKNIFHIMSWATCGKKKFRVRDNFISCGTFEIGSFPKDDEEYIWLR